MKYEDPRALREHISDLLSFYYPTCRDEELGGHIAQLNEETGHVYDRSSRHLVASCRFIQNFGLCLDLDICDGCQAAGKHGFAFLESAHRRPDGGYSWLLDGDEVVDDRRSPYGHAFVLLAHARAVGFASDANPNQVATMLNDRFSDRNGLLGPTRGPDWETIEEYRGQNPNMHACEAYLAAYESTGNEEFIDRAMTIANLVTIELADGHGRIWEHYESDWTPDFEYNRNQPVHQFRPWGFQPGHHAEWAKLLAGLKRHRDAPWLIDRAAELFEYALVGWDSDHGGFCYTLDPNDEAVVRDKFGWAVAEAIAASAALYDQTSKQRYRDWYGRLWSYAEDHLIAPGGNWYTRLNAHNERILHDEEPEVEPGYHPIGACYEGIRTFSKNRSYWI